MLDEIEKWVAEHYGRITTESVDFPQFGLSIACCAVRTMGGISMGMGQSRQLAIHDLYRSLTLQPELETALPPFWQDRRERLNEAQ